jgi:hypothetical protein
LPRVHRNRTEARKAKAPAVDCITAPDKMKPLLALSKRESVNAAIALTGNAEAVIFLDKKARPRQVAALLRASAGKAKIALNPLSVQFGRAEVDPDYGPAMVRFFLNKDSPGTMRPKLVEVVKRATYQKVELNVDPILEEEASDGEAQTEQAPPATMQAPETMTSGPDKVAVTRELAGLIGRIGEVSDPARKAALARLAGEANAALETGDSAAAVGLLALLREELDAPPTRRPL